jgi:hypothetical protein
MDGDRAPGEAVAPTRRTASAARRIMLTERDRRLLAVVGEQYAVTAGQLARLLGRPESHAVYLRNRWVRAGWASCARLTYVLPP